MFQAQGSTNGRLWLLCREQVALLSMIHPEYDAIHFIQVCSRDACPRSQTTIFCDQWANTLFIQAWRAYSLVGIVWHFVLKLMGDGHIYHLLIRRGAHLNPLESIKECSAVLIKGIRIRSTGYSVLRVFVASLLKVVEVCYFRAAFFVLQEY